MLSIHQPRTARQLASRAREHLRKRRPKVRLELEKHQKLLWAFMQACAEGDATALFGLLRQDAVLYSDGGGRVSAAINPIYTAEQIIRLILGLREKQLGELERFPVEVNGGPGIAVTLNGQPYMIYTIEVEDDHIRTIFSIMNPEKMPPNLFC